jgi:hypothetical protein
MTLLFGVILPSLKKRKLSLLEVLLLYNSYYEIYVDNSFCLGIRALCGSLQASKEVLSAMVVVYLTETWLGNCYFPLGEH